MPASIYLMLFLVLALYTYAVFGIRRRIRLRHAVALTLGVILDGGASVAMAMHSAGSWTAHGIIGAIAWLLMLFLMVCVWSLWRDDELLTPGRQRGVWRGAVAFYAIWLLSLVNGYATHVAAVDRNINLIGG